MTLLSHSSRVLPIFAEMQASGMPVDRAYFSRLHDSLTDEMLALGGRISREYFGGKPFNPGSDKQFAALCRRQNVKPRKLTKGGQKSVAEASVGYAKFTNEAVANVFEWRKYQHARDSFVGPIYRYARDGVLRADIKATRTPTRRLAMSDKSGPSGLAPVNLLAIPKHPAWVGPGRLVHMGDKIRAGFRCLDGTVLGAWDYSQIEMRVLAHESDDPELLRIFRDGEDMHDIVAMAIFELEFGELEPDVHRVPAKRTGFGWAYGQSAKGLSEKLWELGLTQYDETECARFQQRFEERFPGAVEFAKRVERELAKTGRVVDMWGMPRDLPGIWSKDRAVKAEAARMAVNHRIQGGAQGMIQNALVWIYEQLYGFPVQFCLEPHDELILRFEPELWPVVDETVREGMIEHSGVELSVPVEVEGKMADNWRDLK